tara:strand:+ start:1978 stop:3081 length:1104 start_codon:yes stop_codon:yes gene_type:complete
MAHTFSSKHNLQGSTANPATLTKNVSSTVTAVVLSIVTTGSGRGGGAPTQGGTTMISSGGSVGDGEQKVEMWYLLNDDVGVGTSQVISIPNTTSSEITCTASYYIAASLSTGFRGAVANGTIDAGTSANPSTTVTGLAGGFQTDVLGSGYFITPTANNRTLLYKGDTGSETYGTQYHLSGFIIGNTSFNWTQPSDDWVHIISLFAENDKPTMVYDTADGFNFGYDATPTIEFTASDIDGDDLTYHFRIDDSSNMASPIIDVYSSGATGFINTVIGGDLNPFTESVKISYTVQAVDALDAGTYYWDCEATDLDGTKTWSSKPKTRKFTTSGDTLTNLIGWDSVVISHIKTMNTVLESGIVTWNGVDWS